MLMSIMVGYLSPMNRTILTAIPTPPPDFVNISNENQSPGQYVIGQTHFIPEKSINSPGMLSRSLDGASEEIILGLLSIVMIMTITEVVLTILSRKRQHQDPERNQLALVAIKVDGLLHLSTKWMNRREHLFSPHKRQKDVILSLLALSATLFIFVADIGAVVLTQPHQYPSNPYSYNLRGSHPIGSNLGLGKFLRRNALERPCVTPVFSSSNPYRNYSLSVCHLLNLKQAHKNSTESVDSVKIGSWFHKGGSDHHLTFGNSSIEIRTRAFVYGASGGTRRLLFPILYPSYMASTHYLHQIVIYMILQESCNAKRSTKRCEDAVAEHWSETEPVIRVIKLWTSRRGKTKEKVQGSETTLRYRIHSRPWITVLKSIGPLMTAELIEEVKGPGFYSHIVSEKEQDSIPGLIVQERRPLGILGMLFCTSLMLIALITLKRILQPVFLADRAWENFERNVLSKLEMEDKCSSGAVTLGKEASSDEKLPAERLSHYRSEVE